MEAAKAIVATYLPEASTAQLRDLRGRLRGAQLAATEKLLRDRGVND
jgi:hypothetical protein